MRDGAKRVARGQGSLTGGPAPEQLEGGSEKSEAADEDVEEGEQGDRPADPHGDDAAPPGGRPQI